MEGRAVGKKGEGGKKGGELQYHGVHIMEGRRGIAVVRCAIEGKMLISSDSVGIKKLGSPGVTCLLMLRTGGTKSINDLLRGSDAKRRRRCVRMSSRGSVGQIEENVPSSDKFGGGEVDTRTARRRGEWSEEGVESRKRSEGT